MADPTPPLIFDRQLYARRRARSATAFHAHDFLHRRAMEDIVDRLESVTRNFPQALFYGVGDLKSMLTPRCGVEEIIEGDCAGARLSEGGASIIFDEEASPLAPSSFDLIVSLLTLHAANDPIGALTQMRLALKPDGLLIAVLFGEETLKELRAALYEAEAEFAGGVSPRIAPFASVRDLGGALQRAGFALPVADVDHVGVRYRSPSRLIEDLRGMGETNCLFRRGKGLRRDTLAAATARLSEAGPITFDLVTLTGWAPHPSQPKPLTPGSAQHSLERFLNRR
ncbi:MAG: methyltransferase domain-containing protein [Pseudomonadota bacterium]